MNAESVFSLCIIILSSFPLIIIGIVQYKSKTPVGFWSGKNPPAKEQVRDIPAYNKKHGLM